jgi:hypothetical protein
MIQWRLICFDGDRFELDVQRVAVANPGVSSLTIGGGAKPLFFAYPPARASGFEVWGMRMTRASVQSFVDQPQFEFTESSVASDGRRLQQTAKLSNEGLAGALDQLLSTCPPAKTPTQTVVSSDRAEK